MISSEPENYFIGVIRMEARIEQIEETVKTETIFLKKFACEIGEKTVAELYWLETVLSGVFVLKWEP